MDFDGQALAFLEPFLLSEGEVEGEPAVEVLVPVFGCYGEVGLAVEVAVEGALEAVEHQVLLRLPDCCGLSRQVVLLGERVAELPDLLGLEGTVELAQVYCEVALLVLLAELLVEGVGGDGSDEGLVALGHPLGGRRGVPN